MYTLRLPNHPIQISLDLDDIEYLLSFLDEEPQDGRENRIRKEIELQAYE